MNGFWQLVQASRAQCMLCHNWTSGQVWRWFIAEGIVAKHDVCIECAEGVVPPD